MGTMTSGGRQAPPPDEYLAMAPKPGAIRMLANSLAHAWTLCAGSVFARTRELAFEQDAGAERLSELLPSLSAVFSLDGEVVSRGRRTEVIMKTAGGKTYYVKRYRAKPRSWRRLLDRNPAETEVRSLRTLAQLRSPVPRVVAFGWEALRGRFLRGVMITAAVPDCMDTASFCLEHRELWADRARRLCVLRQVAGAVRRMHDNGFVHGNLKWRNLLLKTADPPGVVFIDCPSGRHLCGHALRLGIIKDLSSIDRRSWGILSRTDRLRMYFWYRDKDTLDAAAKEEIKRTFDVRQKSIERRIRKKGRSDCAGHLRQ